MMDIEEREYRQLRKLGQKLHLPVPEAFLELEVRDQDGKVIQRHKQRSHSWTRNAYNHLFCELAGKDADDVTFEAGKLSGKDTGGTIQSGNNPLGAGGTGFDIFAGYRANGGIATNGIVVGSGENAESFEDYALQTQITHGTGAGQLSYVASEENSVTYVPLVLKNTLVRYFNNNSGGVVDVNEVGLVARLVKPAIADYLHSRDKLASTVNVPNTGQLKVTYTIQLTYPE